jgi:hypothetical protein
MRDVPTLLILLISLMILGSIYKRLDTYVETFKPARKLYNKTHKYVRRKYYPYIENLELKWNRLKKKWL